MGLLILPLFIAVFYLVAIRPQQKQAREHRDFLAGLEPGDEVVTAAGLYGRISEIEGAIVWLEVAQDLELKFAKDAIARSAVPAAADSVDADAVDEDD